MKVKLTDRFEDVITIDSKEYEIDMAFDNILRFYELYDDKEINDYDKIDYMFQMLLFDGEELMLTLPQKKEIIEQVMEHYLSKEKIVDANGESNQEDTQDEQDEEKKVKEYDLTIDADLIYASFLMDYKIDLFEQQGKLHWKKFIALLSGLSEKTPFMKVIQIRTMEIPQTTKDNVKEVAKIRKMKHHYALEKETQSMQSGLNRAASYLRSKAKVKVGEDKQ